MWPRFRCVVGVPNTDTGGIVKLFLYIYNMYYEIRNM